ncbi:MAG: c-type cytochrome [Paracoccaceae bacterium]|nr:c-type cytochrome [Paracoccaceae bacterium]
MSKSRNLLIATVAALVVAGSALAGSYGLGRPATEAEIAAWDLDIMPDGTGLPVGSGDVWTGEELFSEQCAACHGEFAEGVDNWPELAGGFGTLDREDPVKTVGSYWPYLSTTFDYVRRSMPFGNAQSLTDDETYAIVAYILYSNDLVDDDFVLSNETFLDVEMPNAEGFIVDDRMTTEERFFKGEPCMTDCKDAVEITMRARVLDVTPEDETAEAEVVQAAVTEEAAEQPAAAEAPSIDPALVAAGEKAFKKCSSCHQIGDGAKNRSGPHLNAVFGRVAGSIDGFKYSKGMVSAGEDGLVWSDETMAEFLSKPRSYIQRTKMSFAGFKKAEDIDAVIAYLKSAGG